MANLIEYPGRDKVIKRICELINSLTGVQFEVVAELPLVGQSNIIYLVPKTIPNVDNIYDEYVWINNAYELIGDTEIDLSNYYTKSETDTLLSGKQNKLPFDITENPNGGYDVIYPN